MPRFWLSGPRLFGGLLRRGISFSGRELASWRKKATKVSKEATLGVCRRPNGDHILTIPGMNGDAEHEPGLVPMAAFFFSKADDAVKVRNGALQRISGHVNTDWWISGKSLGQIVQAVRAEAKALGIEMPWARVRIASAGGPARPPEPKMSWADIAVASLLPLLFIALALALAATG